MKRIFSLYLSAFLVCLFLIAFTSCNEEEPTESTGSHASETQEPESSGELPHEHSYTMLITAPTCTEKGYTTHTCTCGSSYFDHETKALGHKYTTYVSDKNATCTADGTKTAACDNCGKEFDTVADTGSRLGHKYTTYVSDKNATCTADGTKTAACDNCGKEFDTVADTGSKLGHRYDNNCDAACNLCGQTRTPSAHIYGSDDVCTVCGGARVTEGLAFTLNSNKLSYSVSGIGQATDFKIVIPSEYLSLPVTAISPSAFAGERWFTDVIIPDSVTSIGQNAFYECTGLVNVTLGNGVTSIGENAFYHCTGLKDIKVGTALSHIGVDAFKECTGLLYVRITDVNAWCKINFANIGANPIGYTHSLYLNDTLIEELTIAGSGKIRIGKWAFYTCTALTRLEIQSGVFSIGEQAFYGCSGIASLTIGNGVVVVDSSAFANCDKMTSVTIGKDVTTLNQSAFEDCDELTTVVMGSGITNIGGRVFYHCARLADVTWSPIVTSVGDEVFGYCSSLRSFDLPISVTFIGERVLVGCTAMESVVLPFIGSSKNLSLGEISQFAYIFGGGTIPPCLKSVSVLSGGIDADDFIGCTTVENMAFGASVTTIDTGSFAGCLALQAITVDDAHTLYASENGILYNKEKTQILFIPVRYTGTFAVTSGHLTASLLRGRSQMTDISIAPGASYEDGAFAEMAGLKTLTLPTLNTTALALFGSAADVPSGFAALTITSQRLAVDSAELAGCHFDIVLLNKYVIGIDVAAKAEAYADEFWNDGKNKINVLMNDGTSYQVDLLPAYISDADNALLYTKGTHTVLVTYEGFTDRFTTNLIHHSFTGVVFEDASFVCSANVNSIYVEGLPEGATVTYEGNGKTEAGTYTVTATITKPYYETLVLTAKMTVALNQFEGITFEDASFMCSANTNSIYINGILPEGTSVVYEGNEQNEAGVYTVTATITKPYYETLVLTAQMTVTLNQFTGIVFEDTTVMCSANNSIYVEGLPEGATVTYEGNGQQAVGVYTVTATITKPYYETLVLTAQMTVKLNEFIGITFEDATVLCSENSSIYVSSLPEGASVIYEGNEQSEAGVYTVTATITKPYYGTLVLTAQMTVVLNQFTGIVFEDTSFVCGPKSNSIYVSGNLPEGTAVVYDGNEKQAAGVYTVQATITNPYYKTLVLTAELTVLDHFTYNGTVLTGLTTIGRELVDVIIPDGVTGIGDFAFDGRTNLESVAIPEGVVSIGNRAFYACTSLESVTISESVTMIATNAFSHCTKLENVSFGENSRLADIGESAFLDCRNLTSITIPASVTNIDDRAFSGCLRLVEVYNLSSLDIAKGDAGNGDLGYYALNIYTSASEESSLTQLNDYVFCESESILYLVGYLGRDTELVLPDYSGKNYVIHKNAFYGRDDITSVVLGNSVTSIGLSAFGYCDLLEHISISSSVINISQNAFVGCSKLIETENGISYVDKWVVDCEEEIVIANLRADTVGIAEYVFSYSNLQSIIIPDSVRSIGRYAFVSCHDLVSVIFADTDTWYVTKSNHCTDGVLIDVTNASDNAEYCKMIYRKYNWYKL